MPRVEGHAWPPRRIAVATRARILFLLGAFVALMGGNACFGLAPPTLAPEARDAAAVPSEPLLDATAAGTDADVAVGVQSAPPPESGPPPAVPDGATAPIDAVAPRLFRCGPSDSCNAESQECCATHPNASWVYQVLDAAVKCPGIPIGCAQPSDCDSQSECCTASTFQACVPRGTCSGFPGGFLTCNPALGSSDCPTGSPCAQYSDPTIPYYYCH